MKNEKITSNFNERNMTVEIMNERGARKLKNDSYAKFSTVGATCGSVMIGDYVDIIPDEPVTKKPTTVVRKPIGDEPENSWGIYFYVDKYTGITVYVGMDKHIESAQRDADHRTQPGQPINVVIQNNPDRYLYVAPNDERGYTHDECAAREIELIDAFGTYENRVGNLDGKQYGFNMIRTFDDVKPKSSLRKQSIDLRTVEINGDLWQTGDWEVPMWDHSKSYFDARQYQRKPGDKPNDGGKCFRAITNGKTYAIGSYFHDYLSAQIVSEFIAAEL